MAIDFFCPTKVYWAEEIRSIEKSFHFSWIWQNFETCYLQFPPFAYIRSCTRLFGTFELAMSKPVNKERVIYLERKTFHPLIERSFEIGRIFAIEGSRRVLVEVVLFQTTSTKTLLEPSMAKNLPISKLLSNNV